MIGVIEPGARAGVAATRNRRIAVIATEGTVKGGAYARAIRKADAATPRSCSSPARCSWRWPRKAGRTLPPPRGGRALSRAAVQRRCGAGYAGARLHAFPGARRCRSARPSASSVALVDSAETTAQAVARSARPRRNQAASDAGEGHRRRFFATDSPERFARVGAIFLGRPIDPKSRRAGRSLAQ